MCIRDSCCCHVDSPVVVIVAFIKEIPRIRLSFPNPNYSGDTASGKTNVKSTIPESEGAIENSMSAGEFTIVS